jgi:hypothetical protein
MTREPRRFGQNRGTDLRKITYAGGEAASRIGSRNSEILRGFVMRQAASRNFPFWE